MFLILKATRHPHLISQTTFHTTQIPSSTVSLNTNDHKMHVRRSHNPKQTPASSAILWLWRKNVVLKPLSFPCYERNTRHVHDRQIVLPSLTVSLNTNDHNKMHVRRSHDPKQTPASSAILWLWRKNVVLKPLSFPCYESETQDTRVRSTNSPIIR